MAAGNEGALEMRASFDAAAMIEDRRPFTIGARPRPQRPPSAELCGKNLVEIETEISGTTRSLSNVVVKDEGLRSTSIDADAIPMLIARSFLFRKLVSLFLL